jgi:hypothetical protein
MDSTGKVLGSPSGRTVEKFREHMKLAKSYVELKAKADKGDAVAKVEFFILALHFGDYKTAEEAKTHLAGLKRVSKEQQAKIDGYLVGFEVQALMEPVRKAGSRQEAQELEKSTGKKFAEMEKAGRIPAKNDDFGSFYVLILAHAEDTKNVPLFEKGLNALKERFGSDINQRFVSEKEATLERLKEEAAEKKKD